MADLAECQVIGIMLVKDEDVFVERAVRNVIAFCDRLIVAEHQSRDRTGDILERLGGELEGLSVVKVESPARTHELVSCYAGTNSWIFAVDGDEVYDPDGLARLRARLERGEFDRYWRVYGNVLNCIEIDRKSMTAKGYLAPPCRSMTKLFNFAAIESWSGDCPERLHGGEIRFAPEYNNGLRRNLQHEDSWESTDFRCLHVCFMRRSSKDGSANPTRQNIMERIEAKKRSGLRWIVDRFIRGSRGGSYKQQKYRRGPLVEKDVAAFFN